MAGVPSIVMGLFVYAIFTLRYGLRGIGGSLALACLMLPVVIRSTETMLRLVPTRSARGQPGPGRFAVPHHPHRRAPRRPARHHQRLPAGGRPGRGGDGPAAVHHRGHQSQPNWNVFSGPNTALSAQIFNLAASSPYIGGIQRAWTAALTLIVMVLDPDRGRPADHVPVLGAASAR